MNKVTLIGNLTANPTLTQTPSGIAVCKMSIAVNRSYANKDGSRDVDYFNITVWRELGENCHRYLKKGKKAAVVGRIENGSYEKNGVTHYTTSVVAEEVEFLSPRDNDERGANDGERRAIRGNTPVDNPNLPF